MRSCKTALFFWILLFLLTMPLVSRAAVPDPTEQMRPFLAKITKILADKSIDNDPECSLCQRVINVAREHFDFREMSKRVLGKQWRKLTPVQQDHFVHLFTKLLQYAYIGKVKDYSGQAIEFKRQRIRGKRAEVQTLLVDGQRTIPVSYIMLLEGDQWMIYDVVVEGVSLVRNYMEQFRQILRKQSFADLEKQLEKKIEELEKERLAKIENKKRSTQP